MIWFLNSKIQKLGNDLCYTLTQNPFKVKIEMGKKIGISEDELNDFLSPYSLMDTKKNKIKKYKGLVKMKNFCLNY